MCLRKAEREGFEPPVPLGTTVFKTVVIDHSTISPEGVICSQPASLSKASAKLRIISLTTKQIDIFFQYLCIKVEDSLVISCFRWVVCTNLSYL